MLATALAWVAVLVVSFLWFDQRGRWKTESGDEGYHACFGAPPPPSLHIVRAETSRHFRLTGKLLALECYVQAEGGFDTGGTAWGEARRLREVGGLYAVLARQGLVRVPDWFNAQADSGRAKVVHSAEGRLVSIYPVGTDGILIAGGWATQAAR